MRRPYRHRWWLVAAVVVALLAGCGPAAAPQPEGRDRAAPPPQSTKTLTMGLSSPLDVIGIATGPSPVGGRGLFEEIHSNGLVTSEAQSRKPIGQLAERVPSLEDGSIELLPDGRMRVTFQLRRDVFWHDGAPFTAHDLVFSHRIQADPGLPLWRLDGAKEMVSTEARDDYSFVVMYHRPYYRGAILGVRAFWPVAAHILREPYERYAAGGAPEEVVNHPYWGAEYSQLGPFRIAQFSQGEEMVLEAHDRYFLGRPKIDVIRVRIFTDQDAMLASVIAGAIDVVPDLALNEERGQLAKERWEADGQGTFHVVEGSPWMVTPQGRPHLQREPATFDPRVRAGFYHALDRETLSEVLNGGNRQLASWSILAPSDELYEATRDGMRRYSYDVDRARAVLREAGWIAGSDGVMRHESDGRRFQTSLTAPTGQERMISTIAAYWRQIGIEVEEAPMLPTVLRSIELRAQLPGWQARGAPAGHGILGVVEQPPPGPTNRWVGANYSGYENPRMQEIIDWLRMSLNEREQLQAMRAISDLVAAELPLLIFYHGAHYLGVRRGVKAFDDLAGGQTPNPLYGGYARNSHLWDVL